MNDNNFMERDEPMSLEDFRKAIIAAADCAENFADLAGNMRRFNTLAQQAALKETFSHASAPAESHMDENGHRRRPVAAPMVSKV